MTETRYSTSAKILKYIAYIMMGAGMVMLMLGISSFFMPAIPGIDPLFMVLFGVVLLFGGALLLGLAQQGIIKPEFDNISLIKCADTPKCKYVKAKKFEKDDYVFKPVDGKCDICNSPLHIAAIFEIEKKPAPEKGSEEKKDETHDLPPLPKNETTQS